MKQSSISNKVYNWKVSWTLAKQTDCRNVGLDNFWLTARQESVIKKNYRN